MDDNSDPGRLPQGYTSRTFALSGKIMLSAIVILFGVVIFMVCLHIYARWYLIRAHRRRRARSRARALTRTHLVLYVDSGDPTAGGTVRGLDSSVIGSLPVFVYSSKEHPEALECPVCLSEFEENEKGRTLPKCNHSFHVDCIDMWFHSHSTCPLCRSPVNPVPENQKEIVVSVVEAGGTVEPADPSSDLCLACGHDDNASSTASSSLPDRRKGIKLAIEVPRRNEPEDELATSSPAGQGFKSPANRLLSFRRIRSMNRRGVAVSPSSGVGTSCGVTATEMDIERGWDESTQQRAGTQTPR